MLILLEYKSRKDRDFERQRVIKTFKKGVLQMCLKVFNEFKNLNKHKKYTLPKVVMRRKAIVDQLFSTIQPDLSRKDRHSSSTEGFPHKFHLWNGTRRNAISTIKIASAMFSPSNSRGKTPDLVLPEHMREVLDESKRSHKKLFKDFTGAISTQKSPHASVSRNPLIKRIIKIDHRTKKSKNRISEIGKPLFANDEDRTRAGSGSLYTMKRLKKVNSAHTSKMYSDFQESSNNTHLQRIRTKLETQPKFTKIFHRYMKRDVSKKEEEQRHATRQRMGIIT
ncbi:unnamed protein product [Moneuplotes crassus]|uniref:Uncharacterized protein n=1 Tax=Euplotes crassus TaxID=5936 RepID=A0AAD2D7Q3_EUPCR|nr:unnamed protein product [Moneuplotes crassus]